MGFNFTLIPISSQHENGQFRCVVIPPQQQNLIASDRLNTAVAQKCRIANPPHAREIGKLGLKDDRSYLQGGLSPGDPGMFHHPDWAVGNHNSGHQPGELPKSK